jgi:hypothetical protein
MVNKIFLSSLVVAIVLCDSSLAQQIRTVALKNQQAPGRPVGDLFKGFHGSSLSSTGYATFRAPLREPSPGIYDLSGVWSENEQGLNYIVAPGDSLSGFGNGETVDRIESWAFNDEGKVALGLGYSDASWPVPSPQHFGIFSNATGLLSPLAIAGQTLDSVYGLTLAAPLLINDDPVMNSRGDVSFAGIHKTNGVHLDASDFGIWVNKDGAFRNVMREGTQPPGTAVGTRFDEYQTPVAMNDHGRVAFEAGLISPGATSFDSTAIFSEGSGSLQLLARTGDQAPTMPEGTVFSSLTTIPDTAPTINNAGHTAFWAGIRPGGGTSKASIWSDATGSISPVAIQGDPAPGGDGGVFGNIASRIRLSLNSTGKLTFTTTMQTGVAGVSTANDQGIWAGKESLSLIAREGQQAPGVPDGVLFGLLVDPTINSRGQVAFSARLSQSTGSVPNNGIWAQDINGDLKLIVCTGDAIEVAPGDVRVVEAVNFSGTTVDQASGNEDGRNSLFNDSGQLLFSASFTDGSRGLFVSSLVAFEALAGDFDLDGDVDGRDFLTWQRNQTIGNLADWQANYSANDQAIVATIPEPNGVLLLGLASLVTLRRSIVRCRG